MTIDAPAHRDDTIEAYESAVLRVIAQMRRDPAAPLDLEQLARIASISKFHLVRVFDEITGTTPHHFLACIRVERAKELLLKPGSSITGVCMEVGYNSLGTFSSTFSDLVGLSPQEFREMPKRMSAAQFAAAIWRYLRARRKISGPAIEGTVEGPRRPAGFTFVGTFTRGVPQGVPFSGTVMIGNGGFRIERPPAGEFHLLAALAPLSANLTSMVVNIPIKLVASLRVRDGEGLGGTKPRLRLRALRETDPPIVMALPALPPLRG